MTSNTDHSPVPTHLEHLETAGLVRAVLTEIDPTYMFHHALIQDAAYSSLLRQDRRRLHLVVGRALEQLYANQLAELAPQLGQHFLEAGEEQQALHYLILAGDEAFRHYALKEAIGHYRQAIALPAHFDLPTARFLHLYQRCGRALEIDSQYEAALRLYQTLEALALRQGDVALEMAALTLRATILMVPGPVRDPDQGLALAKRALVLAQQLGDRPAEAKALWNMMLGYSFGRDAVQALQYGEQSLQIARELNLQDQLAFTLNDIHYCYAALGQHEQARAALAEARDLWRAQGNLPMLSDNLTATSQVYYDQGNLTQTMVYAEEALTISLSINNLWSQTRSMWMMGAILLEWGELGRAIDLLERGSTLGQQAGLEWWSAGMMLDLMWAYTLVGARAAVLEQSQRARTLTLISPFGIENAFASVLAIQARLEVRVGNLDRAAEVLARISPSLISAPRPLESLPFIDTMFAMADLALAQGDYGLALTCMARLPELQSMETRFCLADRWYVEGKALLGQGQFEAAQEQLQKALDRVQEMGSPMRLWPILWSWSSLEVAQGHPEAATRWRQEAAAIIMQIADLIGNPDFRASFLNLPPVRTVLDSIPE